MFEFSELYAAVDREDWDRMIGYYDSDVVYERPGYEPLCGVAALLRFYRDERVLAAGRHVVEVAIVQGDGAACSGFFTGTKRDGAGVDVRFADVFTLREGRIAHRRTHFFRPCV